MALGDDNSDLSADWGFDLGDGARWDAWHTWSNGRTVQVDGKLVFRDEMVHHLDVYSLGDDDGCVTAQMRSDAPAVWEAGGVLVGRDGCPGGGVVMLVVPHQTLATGTIFDAIRRWVADGMRTPPPTGPGADPWS